MRRASLLLAVSILCASAPSFADGAADEARATELKQKGDAAMDSLHYDEALAAYSEAYGLSHNAALLYNRGRVYQARGDFPTALADIERFDKEASAELRARVPKLAELLVELRGKVATVAISSKTAGARVLIRNQLVGTTPLEAPLKLNSGPAIVELTKDGFFPYHRELTLPGGDVAIVAELEPKASKGQLVVSTDAGGTILVDGKSLGGPRAETILDPGPHKVAARKDGADESVTTVVIVAGERKEISIATQKPAITSRWWFWGGVGVVVAGGVVAAVILRPERAPSAGDKFSPNQVTASLFKW